MRLSRITLIWVGLGALVYVAAFLSGLRLGMISLLDNNQAATTFMVIIAGGFMFLSMWARLVVIRKISSQFALAYRLCVLVAVALVAIAVTQLAAMPHDRISAGTELIWCVITAVCGLFIGPFADVYARKHLKQQGYL